MACLVIAAGLPPNQGDGTSTVSADSNEGLFRPVKSNNNCFLVLSVLFALHFRRMPDSASCVCACNACMNATTCFWLRKVKLHHHHHHHHQSNDDDGGEQHVFAFGFLRLGPPQPCGMRVVWMSKFAGLLPGQL